MKDIGTEFRRWVNDFEYGSSMSNLVDNLRVHEAVDMTGALC